MRRLLIDRAGALGTPLLAVALLAALALATAHSRADDSVLTSSRKGSFTIKGHVLGLYPGSTARLTLTVRNTNSFADQGEVDSRQGRERRRTARARTSSSRTFAARCRVAAKRKRRLQLPIGMRSTAPDACMGARFPLRYAGKAVKG